MRQCSFKQSLPVALRHRVLHFVRKQNILKSRLRWWDWPSTSCKSGCVKTKSYCHIQVDCCTFELEGVIFLKNGFCKCLTHQECFLGQIICTIQPQIGKCKSSRSTETPTNEREDCTNSINNETNNTLQPQHHSQSTV